MRNLSVWRGGYLLMPLIWASPLSMTQAQSTQAQSTQAQSTQAPYPRSEDPATLYIVRRGWHIDIGMAAADLQAPLNSIANDLPQARFIFFGFGDKHYLLAKKHNAPVLLGALWPGAGIMLVTGLPNSPEEAFGAGHVIRLMLAAEQAQALQAFIRNSFDIQGETINIYKQGPYEGSLYYLSAARYSAFHTCNTWGAQALRSAGFRVRTKGVIFAGQLWSQALKLQRTQAQAQQSARASLLLSFTPDIG